MPPFAHAFWPCMYGLLARLDPFIERAWRRGWLHNTVQLLTIGRQTGLERRSFLGLLRLGKQRYLGHPDVACPWTLNLEAASVTP